MWSAGFPLGVKVRPPGPTGLLSRSTELPPPLDPGVSRRHVLVMATPGGYTIRDLGSQNGTYVNGNRVDESPLTDGDRITIGEINLVFRGTPAAVSV